MASPIKIKRSAVAGRVPTTSDLQLGELGLNTNDGKLYAKKDDGSESIVELSSGGGSGTFVEVNGDNMTGNLTLGTSNIILDASDGSAEFAGDLTISDKIIHNGDTNTAVRFPANDTVSVETGGSERLRIDSSGDVGIGGTLPSAPNVELKADGTIEMANAALGALLGYDQNELAGRPFASLVGESTRTEVANGLSRLGETGETLTLDTTYLRKDGSEVAVAFSASLMGTGTGAGQRIVSVAQDITERKRAEADLRFRADFEQIICTASKSFVNLPSSDIASEIDRILAAVGEFLNAGRGYVFTFSDDGRSMSSTHEWSASGIEPRFGGLQQLSTTDFPWWMERLNRLEDIRVDRVADLPEGERRTRETLEAQDVRSLVLLPMALGGHLFGLIGFDAVGEERQWSEDAVALLAVVRDIIMNALERERTEAERRALEAQVQHAQKLEGLGVLAGGIAHDFNNILAAILGNAELAMLALPEGAAASSSVGEIRAAAVRAAELVSQMLAYSGKTPFSLEAVDLNRLVTEMGRLLRVTLSKNAELRYYTGDDLPAIRADAARVRQVAMNLITNASEALGDEPGVVSVSTGVVQATREYLAGAYLAGNLPEGEYVFLQVTDTGCGFEAEVEAELFDPFFSTKFTGRGLGLAAVFGIVRGHQGAIFVRGRSGRGATFRVLFPSAGARPASPPPPEHVPAVDEWRGSGTVLFADDEPALRRTVPHILRKLGFEVLLAEDGGEAVRLFGEHRDQLAVVILDLTMPVMNGIEAFQRIRRLDHYAKVILASGYPQDQVPGGFSQTGLAGFLQKPYDVRRLQACLRDVLATEAASHTEDC